MANKKTKEIKEEKKELEPNPQPEEPKPNMVEVPKSFIDELQSQMKEMKEKQGMLEQIADKRQLAAYYARNKKKLPKVVSLRVWDGKVVVGWRTVDNEVYQDPLTNAWREKQTVEIVNEDGKLVELQYLNYVREFKRVNAMVVSSTTDEKSGSEILKVKREDTGKTYDIDVRYVN